MGRMLMKAMHLAGHDVEIASELRGFLREQTGATVLALDEAAEKEIANIVPRWRETGTPDIWFCYHPYYKTRDRLGPELCRRFGVAYVTAEASYAPKRNATGWAETQAALLEDLRFAAVNICFTARDRDGLRNAAPDIRFAMLPPFIETSAFTKNTPSPIPYRLATVAMMRSGDKLSSYAALAEALKMLPEDLPWSMDVIGDGPESDAVHNLFAGMGDNRIIWHGEKTAEEIATILSRASLYVWPGHGEAYGLAYLEAQAAGLPVVAEHIAGVPEVVRTNETGILTTSGDVKAYAQAIEELLRDDKKRQAMASRAQHFATVERSLEQAAITLDGILKTHAGHPS